MRRVIVLAVIVGMMTTVLAATAAAAPPHTGCPVGPVDSGGSTIGDWEPWDQEEFEDAIEAMGFDPVIAVAVFAKEDRNNDGLLCVMTQTLPNTASGSDTFLVTRDNVARAK